MKGVCLKSVLAGMLTILAVSTVLGLAAAAEGGPGISFGRALLFVATLTVMLAAFVLVLPRFFKQPLQILLAMVTGVLAGWAFDTWGEETFVLDYLGIFGNLFIVLLKMVVIPLVFASIVSGLAAIGSVKRVGRLGAKTFFYYFFAGMVASAIGLLCVNLVKPGVGRGELMDQVAQQEAKEHDTPTWGKRVQQEFIPAVVPVLNMAKIPILPIIFAAILLGLALAFNGERSAAATAFFESLNEAVMTVVSWIMYLAPIGVFSLMAGAIAGMGLGYLGTLAAYVFTVILGLSLHFCFLVFILVPFLARYSPIRFIRAMAPALELGFSTSSSSATLPVSLECITERVGVSKSVAGFMLPLGATVNMNGTALYQAVAAVFIAQVYGMELHLQGQMLIFLTSILVSVGTAGIPGASVGLMVLVLSSVGLPAEGIGLILGVDRFLDMCRTTVNVVDDSVCAAIVAYTEGELNPPEHLA